MKLEILTNKEYDAFAYKHKNVSIYSLSNWGKLKEKTGWKTHLVGFKEKNKVIAAAMLLEKATPIHKSLFYSPRGFLIDFDNQKLLKDFTDEVIKYIKKHKGFLLKIDPNVIYKTRTDDFVDKVVSGKNAHQNILDVGFKHLGFTNEFETLQPRCLCGFNIKDTYEETLNSFQKSARKNIEKAEKYGVITREIKDTEIDNFMTMLNIAGDKHDFVIRPKWYYEEMLNLFKKDIKYYITYIDVKKHINYLENRIKETNFELEDLKVKFEKYNVGAKLEKQKTTAEKNLNEYINKLDSFKKEHEKEDIIYIGALMSLFVGNEGVTFMSGTDPKYKDFYPKYSYYNEHIKECIKQKKQLVNFYGISGNTTSGAKYYSIYEIKKGFNPDIIELLGEYDYIINKLDFVLYKVALFLYKIKKKLFH